FLSLAGDGPGQLLELVGRAGGQHQPRSRGGGLLRQAPANAARGAGNQQPAAFQVPLHAAPRPSGFTSLPNFTSSPSFPQISARKWAGEVGQDQSGAVGSLQAD